MSLPRISVEVDYYVTERISMDETRKHMRRNLKRGDKAIIHKHGRDEPCLGTCERFEI